MQKVYYLSTCDTCKRILDELNLPAGFTLQEIKENPITETQLQELYASTGSYEALFNKRARLYRERGLNTKDLEDKDYKGLLLDHYTFLKRPVVILGDKIFVGNSKKTVAAAKEAIHG
ncbi:MAG: hypothetical protein CL868_07735 [Cytophagaceae bacterium]|nr:hypothetical protein [Cytophagaceae bacterium]|tara:strand:- start:29182 stop:29535 length:354 start_codon:yes stop_codon:yes gene_type:complete